MITNHSINSHRAPFVPVYDFVRSIQSILARTTNLDKNAQFARCRLYKSGNFALSAVWKIGRLVGLRSASIRDAGRAAAVRWRGRGGIVHSDHGAQRQLSEVHVQGGERYLQVVAEQVAQEPARLYAKVSVRGLAA